MTHAVTSVCCAILSQESFVVDGVSNSCTVSIDNVSLARSHLS